MRTERPWLVRSCSTVEGNEGGNNGKDGFKGGGSRRDEERNPVTDYAKSGSSGDITKLSATATRAHTK